MKAVLNATGFNPELMPLVRHRPTPLFRIVDKPIIIHIIEFLAHHHITEVELVLSHLPELIEEEMEEGTRWGIKIVYHLARDPQKPFSVLAPVAGGWKDAFVLIGRADVLPAFAPQKLKVSTHGKPLLLYSPKQEWTGWGLIAPSTLANIPADVPFNALPEHIGEHHRQLTQDLLMEVNNYRSWRQSNKDLIQRRTSNATFPSSSRMVEPGIWLSRATTLHPTAVITPPVFIGDHCQILENASIGPNVVIESHCIVDKETVIENSIICERSYIGKSLELHDSVVDRDILINLSLETAMKISNDFILAHLTPPPISQKIFKISERIIALLLLLITAPAFFSLALFWTIRTTKIAKLPILEEHEPWPTFQLYTFAKPKGRASSKLWNHLSLLPTFINIVKGDMHFVGVHPLTVEQLEKLLPDWQSLYRKTKTGMVTLADVDYEEDPSESERFASETYYAAHEKVRLDLTVLARCVRQKVSRLFGSGLTGGEETKR